MVQKISPKEAQVLLATGEVEIVDVREPNEWLTGHLEGARLLPLAAFRQNPKAARLGDAVLFVCAAGVRSETAARVAAGLGIGRVFTLVGGTRAWTRAGLPLIRPEYASTAAE